jgi:pimeloyl-ACP methyl ester carboxylesterase
MASVPGNCPWPADIATSKRSNVLSVDGEIRYAKSDGVNVAYTVGGEGPLDVVLIPGFISHLEVNSENPRIVRAFARMASFARIITFDKRGTGLSDRGGDLPTMEQRMDDARAVMDAVGSERAALIGISEGGPLAMLFAATYPERTTALVLYGTYARFLEAPDYPWGNSMEVLETGYAYLEPRWGTGVGLSAWAPSVADDPQMRQWWARYQRLAASPGAAMGLMRSNVYLDARPLLPAITAPTLVLHRTDDRMIKVGAGRDLASRIPGAKYVELPGADHMWFTGDTDRLLDEIEEFLTGARSAHQADRVLATVMFTDVVGSTERAAQLGDRRWRDLLEGHNDMVRAKIASFRGRAVKATGDGFLAAFDGPERAIGCAEAVMDAAPGLGIEIRTGVHSGVCEAMGDDLGGMAVHIAARVAATAEAGEILVSNTVKELVAGSSIRFQDRGRHKLKGIPDQWRLFAVQRA